MRRYVIVIAGVVLLAGAALAGAQTKVDETRPLAATGTVEIETIAGSVDIVGWSRDQVEVTGTLGENVEKLEIRGDEHRLEISVEPKDMAHGHLHGHVEAELTIKVPAGASVEVDAVSAKLTVDGLAGGAKLESVSGAVTVSGRPSSLAAESVSAEVTVAFAPDRSQLESVSGTIEVADGTGSLEASNVSGTINVKGGQFDSADLETVSGAIHWDAAIAGRGPFDMESMSGAVDLSVPASIAADFEVSTFSGGITSDLGPAPERTSKYTPGKELKFVAGSGGPRVSLSSFSGSVRITTR